MPPRHCSDAEARGSPDLLGLHAIVAFLVTVLVNLVQMKFQGKPVSPFETHQFATSLAVFCLLLYCSLALVAHLSLAPDCCARAFPYLMMLAATLSVASLMSLLAQRPLHSSPYLLSLVLLSMVLLSMFVRVFRPLRPAATPGLPRRIKDACTSRWTPDLVQDGTALDVLQRAHHQRTPGNDFQICNRGSSDSGSSTAASDGGQLADLQLRTAVPSPDSALATPLVAMAEGDGQIMLEIAETTENVLMG